MILHIVILVLLLCTSFCIGSPPPTDTGPVLFQDGESSIEPENPLVNIVSICCTVVNSGSFEWTWEHEGNLLPANDKYNILVVDATRSSVLKINKLQRSDSGKYSCIVNPQNSTIVYTRAMNLSLEGNSLIRNDIQLCLCTIS